MKKLQQKNDNEEDCVRVVLQHDIGVDNGMQQHLLVLLQRLQRLDAKCFVLGKVRIVQGHYRRHIQTDHELLRVLVLPVGADVLVKKVGTKVQVSFEVCCQNILAIDVS